MSLSGQSQDNFGQILNHFGLTDELKEREDLRCFMQLAPALWSGSGLSSSVLLVRRCRLKLGPIFSVTWPFLRQFNQFCGIFDKI